MGGLRARAPAGGQEQGIRSCLSRPRACGLSVHRILAVVDVWPLLHQDEAPSIPQPQRDQTLSLFCKSPFLSTLSQDWAQSPTRGCWKLAPRCSAAPPPARPLAPCFPQGRSFPSSGSSPESSPHPHPQLKSQVTSARLARSQQAIGEVWGVSGSVSWFSLSGPLWGELCVLVSVPWQPSSGLSHAGSSSLQSCFPSEDSLGGCSGCSQTSVPSLK